MSGEVMQFPERPEEYLRQYAFTDKEEVYTNGADLIPVFRVRQMLDHYRSTWIPIADLPPLHREEFDDGGSCLLAGPVLVVDETGQMEVARYERDGDREYWTTLDGTDLTPTHWMELPAPPEDST